jgi:predicted RNA-binding protein associated with RNAse of E/G family
LADFSREGELMNRDELLTALECGDIGDVEFFELALETGLTLEEIGVALEQAIDPNPVGDRYDQPNDSI